MEFESMSNAFLLPFLSFLQLFLEPLLVGDIAGESGDAANSTALVANDIAAIPDMTRGTIGTNDSILGVVVVFASFLIEKSEGALVIVGMNGVEPGVRIGVKTAARAAPNGFVGRANI